MYRGNERLLFKIIHWHETHINEWSKFLELEYNEVLLSTYTFIINKA